jgi:hypothetical protein
MAYSDTVGGDVGNELIGTFPQVMTMMEKRRGEEGGFLCFS